MSSTFGQERMEGPKKKLNNHSWLFQKMCVIAIKKIPKLRFFEIFHFKTNLGTNIIGDQSFYIPLALWGWMVQKMAWKLLMVILLKKLWTIAYKVRYDLSWVELEFDSFDRSQLWVRLKFGFLAQFDIKITLF